MVPIKTGTRTKKVRYWVQYRPVPYLPLPVLKSLGCGFGSARIRIRPSCWIWLPIRNTYPDPDPVVIITVPWYGSTAFQNTLLYHRGPTPPPPLHVATAGKNHLNEGEITSPPLHWDRQAILPNHIKFALAPMWYYPYKRKCWPNLGGPLAVIHLLPSSLHTALAMSCMGFGTLELPAR